MKAGIMGWCFGVFAIVSIAFVCVGTLTEVGFALCGSAAPHRAPLYAVCLGLPGMATLWETNLSLSPLLHRTVATQTGVGSDRRTCEYAQRELAF